MLLTIAAFLTGGLLNRWRGGWLPWPPSHTLRRLGVTLGLAGLAFLVSNDWRVGLAGLLVFFGLLPPWGEWFDMGRMGGTLSDDFWGMTGRGLVLTALPGFSLTLLGYGPWVMISGAMMGPIYLGAWWAIGWLFDEPTSVAEFLFMGWVFAVFAASVS